MHGHDLQPLLVDPNTPWDHPVVLENFYLSFGTDTEHGCTTGAILNSIPWWISLTDSRYQYIRTLVPDMIEELYDRKNDPLELKNLALESDHATVLADQRERLIAELKRSDGVLVDKLPAPRIFVATEE